MLFELLGAALLAMSPAAKLPADASTRAACALITRRDVSKVFGGSYAFSGSTRAGRNGPGGTAITTHSWLCRYVPVASGAKQSIVIRVNEFATPAAAHRAIPKWLAEFGAAGTNVTTIPQPDLGDEASLQRSPLMRAICVRRGDTLVMIDVSPSATDQQLDALGAVALGRL
jgi:hypothetical protein